MLGLPEGDTDPFLDTVADDQAAISGSNGGLDSDDQAEDMECLKEPPELQAARAALAGLFEHVLGRRSQQVSHRDLAALTMHQNGCHADMLFHAIQPGNTNWQSVMPLSLDSGLSQSMSVLWPSPPLVIQSHLCVIR